MNFISEFGDEMNFISEFVAIFKVLAKIIG